MSTHTLNASHTTQLHDGSIYVIALLVLPEQPKRAYYLKPGISWSNGFTQKIQIELYVNWYLYSIQAMGTGIN